MEMNELKGVPGIGHEIYPYEYAQFTVLKMRESDLEWDMEQAPPAEKKRIESQLEKIRAKLQKYVVAENWVRDHSRDSRIGR